MEWIFFQLLANKQHLCKAVPRLCLLQAVGRGDKKKKRRQAPSYQWWRWVPCACSQGNIHAASLTLGAACKGHWSIPGTGKVGICEEPLSPQPTMEWGGTAAGIDRCLRNQRLLYYIIIDVAGKCHRRSAACCLLCCIVSLVCVGPLCFASSVPIACLFIPCTFSFHISPANPSWKNQL